MNSPKKCPFNKINTITKGKRFENIKGIFKKKFRKLLNHQNTQIITILDNISFYLLDELDKVKFEQYIEQSDLHHDKDISYFLNLFNSIISPILSRYPLTSSDKKSLERYIGKNLSAGGIVEHLNNLYSIAFFDMHSIICLEKNNYLSSSEGKKIVLGNMYGGKAIEGCTPSELIFMSILYGEGKEKIIEKLRKINTLSKNSCPYLHSSNKMDFINTAFTILKEKFIPALQDYEQYVDKKYDSQGVYLFGLNKKAAD